MDLAQGNGANDELNLNFTIDMSVCTGYFARVFREHWSSSLAGWTSKDDSRH